MPQAEKRRELAFLIDQARSLSARTFGEGDAFHIEDLTRDVVRVVERHLTLIVSDNHRTTLGYILYYTLVEHGPTPSEQGQVVWVEQLAILEGTRRSGYGRRLMDAVIEEANEASCEAVRLMPVFASGKFYLALGFKLLPESARMELRLRPGKQLTYLHEGKPAEFFLMPGMSAGQIALLKGSYGNLANYQFGLSLPMMGGASPTMGKAPNLAAKRPQAPAQAPSGPKPLGPLPPPAGKAKPSKPAKTGGRSRSGAAAAGGCSECGGLEKVVHGACRTCWQARLKSWEKAVVAGGEVAHACCDECGRRSSVLPHELVGCGDGVNYCVDCWWSWIVAESDQAVRAEDAPAAAWQEVEPLLRLQGPFGGGWPVNLALRHLRGELGGGFSLMARVCPQGACPRMRIFHFCAGPDEDVITAGISEAGSDVHFSVCSDAGPLATAAVHGGLAVGKEVTWLFAVSESGYMRVFGDGKLLAEQPFGVAPRRVHRPHLIVGNHYLDDSQGFKGTLRDVAVWDRAVSWPS